MSSDLCLVQYCAKCWDLDAQNITEPVVCIVEERQCLTIRVCEGTNMGFAHNIPTTVIAYRGRLVKVFSLWTSDV